MTAPTTKDGFTALEQGVEVMRATIEVDNEVRTGCVNIQLPLTSATSFSSCPIRYSRWHSLRVETGGHCARAVPSRDVPDGFPLPARGRAQWEEG